MRAAPNKKSSCPQSADRQASLDHVARMRWLNLPRDSRRESEFRASGPTSHFWRAQSQPMHTRRPRSPSAKSTTDQSIERQHALLDLIAKVNREHCRETRAARWSRRTCKPQTRKRSQATSIQLAFRPSSNVVFQLTASQVVGACR